MTITVAALEQYTNHPVTGLPLPPSVRLTVTTTTGTPNPVPAGSYLDVFRRHPDGSEHRVLASTDPRSSGGSWIDIDYHAPYNVPITYRVAVGASTGTSTQRQLSSTSAWLVSATDPSISVMCKKVRNIGNRGTSSRSGRFDIAPDPDAPGKTLPVFVSDGSRGPKQFPLIVQVAPDALDTLTRTDEVLLLNTPGVGWRVGWMWVQPLSIDSANPGVAHWPWDEVTLELVESADPDVLRRSPWTADIALAQFLAAGKTTADSIIPLYANSNNLKVNLPI